MEHAVSLDLVSKTLGGRLVVNDVTLAVAAGEFFSLLGPSGCGKTTTLRMICGFEEPDRGVLKISGEDMRGVPPYRRPCNLVFQDYALFPHLTVAENVAFGLEMLRLPRAEITPRVRESLELVQMAEFAARKPHELSGGQRQRAAVARAVARRPALLLLDEPLGALDLKLRREMQFELKRLQRRLGTTFVYVTHDQEEALTMSDRVAVMRGGRVAQLGAPSDLYERPESAFVARFLGEANVLAGRVVASDSSGTQVRCGGVVFTSADGKPAGGDVVDVVLRPERIAVAPDPDGPFIVDEATFAGATIRYLLRAVDTSEGPAVTLVLRCPAEHAPRAKIGDRVAVKVPPDAVRLLAPEAEE